MTASEAKEILENERECVATDCDRECGKCPLVREEKDILKAFEMAVEALEKQIPKKPVEGYVFAEWLRKRLLEKQPDRANARGSCCPSCGKHIGEGEMTLRKKNGHPFCRWCGQSIDWSEE